MGLKVNGIKLGNGWLRCEKVLNKSGNDEWTNILVGDRFTGLNAGSIEIGKSFCIPGDMGLTTSVVVSIYEHEGTSGFDKLFLPSEKATSFDIEEPLKKGDILFGTLNSVYLLTRLEMNRPKSRYDYTKVANFAMHHLDSHVNAYSKDIIGCQSTGAKVMLTFGSKIEPLNGSNEPLGVEEPKFVDVFLNTTQAESLYRQLGEALLHNSVTPDPKDNNTWNRHWQHLSP